MVFELGRAHLGCFGHLFPGCDPWQPGIRHKWAYWQSERVHFPMLYHLQILVPDAMGDIVGSSGSWWWPKVGCEWWAVSGQLLARVPEGVVGAKGAVTANGTVETKGVIPLELSILSWLLEKGKFGHKPQGVYA